MKFSINSVELKAHLQIAGGAIGSNPVLPILEDFLFTIHDNILIIMASDLETTIVTQVEVMSDKNGSIAIPAKMLLETLKALPSQPITFTVNEETFAVQITSAYGKYKLAGENGTDFPRLPGIEDASTIELSANTLQEGITKSLFATSNDELRPAMTGIYFNVDFNKMVMVATDAHKLVKYTYTDMNSEVSSSFIIPKKPLNLLKNHLPKEGTVKLTFNNANAFFEFDGIQTICRLVDARYPDYNAVIPLDNPNELTINRSDCESSLKRIGIYANKTTNQVILNVKDGALTISAQDLDFSNEATEQMTCTFNGDPMNIGFNAKFLAEMLGVLDSEEVTISLSGPTRAGVLKPVTPTEGVDFMGLLMPVMISA